MPVGLIIMKWDARSGTQNLARYPEDIKITEQTEMQIIAAHEYSGEVGIINLMAGAFNILSYYTGLNTAYYINLLLNFDDDPDIYESGLIDASQIILQNITDNAFIKMTPSLFQRISIYPKLSEEQLLAITYLDEIKRIIIKRLREEGVISKSELEIWLKDTSKHMFVELDAVLNDLIKRDLIKSMSVKGISSELIFFINDIIMSRVPAEKVITGISESEVSKEISDEYIKACTEFFQNYQPSEEDNVKLLEILSDYQIFLTLRLLRTSIVTKNDLNKLVKKGVEDLEKVLTQLLDKKMIRVFKDDKGIEHYALISDFYIGKLFPKYLLRTIKANYEEQSKSNLVLLEYLNILEDTYYDLKSKKE